MSLKKNIRLQLIMPPATKINFEMQKLQLIMPPAAKIHFEMQKLQLITPPAAQIHFFWYFQDVKRKVQFFLGCRYSAGTYLIFFVSKFGANSAKNHQNLN